MAWPSRVVDRIGELVREGLTDEKVAERLKADKVVRRAVSTDQVGRIRREVLGMRKPGGRPSKNGSGKARRPAKVAANGSVQSHVRAALVLMQRHRSEIEGRIRLLRHEHARVGSAILSQKRVLRRLP